MRAWLIASRAPHVRCLTREVIDVSEVPGMPAMPLAFAQAGETVTVQRVRGAESLKHHLANLGFVEGSQVHVVANAGSNIIVMVKGARLGLDAKVAQHVMAI